MGAQVTVDNENEWFRHNRLKTDDTNSYPGLVDNSDKISNLICMTSTDQTEDFQ